VWEQTCNVCILFSVLSDTQRASTYVKKYMLIDRINTGNVECYQLVLHLYSFKFMITKYQTLLNTWYWNHNDFFAFIF
jgi:hypothetical protein